MWIGTEPVLWSSALFWRLPAGSEVPDDRVGHERRLRYDEFAFHYDVLDFRSVTMFAYLTDVDERSGPHAYVAGTHRNKRLGELFKVVLSDDEVDARYPGRTETVLGPAGTTFFEETCGYHKAWECETERLALKLDYVVQRAVPPPREGELSDLGLG